MGDEFIIPIDTISKNFENHLKIENNNRILFSGKFGVGKTFFINRFFNNKSNEYEIFHLFPINYQINTNEDIIELLKYDILVELTKKNQTIFNENKIKDFLDISNIIYLFGKNNIWDIFKVGVSYIPKLGRPLKETINLTEKFWTFKNELEAGEKGIINKFLDEIKKKDIKESDYLSELINNKIKSEKGEKESILILDDLDRIDPEHIFRLLNIFGAHFDSNNKEITNKFGFDKIILVGDYNNIKSIFHHKYGKESDFNGYINKFFSYEPYKFNNDIVIESITDDIIKNMKIGNNELDEAMKDLGYIKIFLSIILKQACLLDGKYKLNLRELLKGLKFQLQPLNNKISKHSENETIELTKIAIKCLISIFGNDKNYLIDIIEKIKENNLIKEYNIQEKFYHHFSYYIYSDINSLENINDTTVNHYKEYSFNVKINNKKIVLINNKKINSFFYDLLKDYINNEF